MKEPGGKRRESDGARRGDDRSALGDAAFGDTVASDSAPLDLAPDARAQDPKRGRRRPARRHPDIEVGRLLVKRGFVAKRDAVEALRVQKTRAQAGKPRLAFLKLLVSRGALAAERLAEAQDEIRRHTYICDACEARAVILAGSQTRAGACPRCGNEISVTHQGSVGPSVPVPPADFRPRDRTARAATAGEASSETEPWRPMEEEIGQLAPGKQAFGRYKLLEELGRGAMGVVYRARHLDLNKDVALKVLVTSEEGREGQVARFRREAAAVQKLRHDGIVAVHDFGCEGDVYYLTMDLVEDGDSLHRALKRREPLLGLRRRLEALVEVADAVAHAHERGVIHRDLKPANVLLRPDGRAIVVDFGLAKDEGDEGQELTRTHDRLGTPLFMAPEQIRRGAAAVDARADVWALGVMLFVCVTGRYPFRSRTVMDLYLRIMREPPDWEGTRYSAPDRGGLLQGREPRPSELDAGQQVDPFDPSLSSQDSQESTQKASRTGPDGALPKTLPARMGPEPRPAPPPFVAPPELAGLPVPPDLRRIVECALAKDPSDRYASATAFAEDLRRYLAGRPVEARSPSLWKRLREQLRRRTVLAWLAASLAVLVLLLGGGGAALLAWQSAQRRESRRQSLDTGRAALATLDEDKVAAADALLETMELEHGDELLVRAQVRARALRFAAAREDLERAEALLPDGPEREAVLCERALVELVEGKEALGVAYALRAIQAVTHPEPATVERLAQAVFARVERGGDPAEVASELSRLDEACAALAARTGATAPAGLPAWRARIALVRGDPQGALKLLPPPAAAGAPREPLDLFLARAATELAQPTPDLERARALLDAARGMWSLREASDLGSYFNILGFKRKVRKLTLEAAQANRAAALTGPFYSPPRMYQGRLFLTHGADSEAAERELLAAVALDPWNAEARGLLTAILALDPRREAELSAVLEQERGFRPDAPEPELLLCALSLRGGRWIEARDRLARAASKNAADEPGAPPRAALWETCLELLERGAGALPSPNELVAWPLEDRCELARVFLERGEVGRAAALLQEEGRALGGGGLARLAFGTRWALLARLRARGGEVERALDALERAVYLKRAEGVDWNDPLPPQVTPAYLQSLPELKALHEHERFEALKQELYRRRETVARLEAR